MGTEAWRARRTPSTRKESDHALLDGSEEEADDASVEKKGSHTSPYYTTGLKAQQRLCEPGSSGSRKPSLIPRIRSAQTK
jgi:hypothetical protein